MSFRTCIHLKVNGQQCQSPALRNSTKCHFHHQHRRLKKRQINLDLHTPEARMKVLHAVINAVFDHRVEPEVARTLMYAINSSQKL